MRDTKEKWVTIIKIGGDEAVNRDSSGVRGERGAEAIYAS